MYIIFYSILKWRISMLSWMCKHTMKFKASYPVVGHLSIPSAEIIRGRCVDGKCWKVHSPCWTLKDITQQSYVMMILSSYSILASIIEKTVFRWFFATYDFYKESNKHVSLVELNYSTNLTTPIEPLISKMSIFLKNSNLFNHIWNTFRMIFVIPIPNKKLKLTIVINV